MRYPKDLGEAIIVLRELLDFKESILTKDIDRRGLRLKNNGTSKDPSDFITRQELLDAIAGIPGAPTAPDQFYAIVFSSTGDVAVGSAISAPYAVARGREGQPHHVSIAATVAPVGASIKANLQLTDSSGNMSNLLVTDIELPASSIGPVVAANFIDPLPRLGLGCTLIPIITQVGSTTPGSLVSVILSVKRIKI